MDFDKPKVYGDTSITDGLVIFRGSEKDGEAMCLCLYVDLVFVLLYSGGVRRMG